MPVLNCLMSIGASKYGDFDTMHLFFACNLWKFGQFMPCAIPEILDSTEGCYLQAWSSAMLINVFLGCYMGICAENRHLSSSTMLRHGSLSSVKLKALRVRDSVYSVRAGINGTGESVSAIYVEA